MSENFKGKELMEEEKNENNEDNYVLAGRRGWLSGPGIVGLGSRSSSPMSASVTRDGVGRFSLCASIRFLLFSFVCSSSPMSASR